MEFLENIHYLFWACVFEEMFKIGSVEVPASNMHQCWALNEEVLNSEIVIVSIAEMTEWGIFDRTTLSKKVFLR